MSAYLVADVDVTDAARYEEYKRLSSLAMRVHGAEICVRGGPIELLEGDWQPKRLVILKFPSVAAAKAFNGSVEYARARTARAGAATMRMVVVEGD
jgi:uncharacterized protein (DUF1330 family)